MVWTDDRPDGNYGQFRPEQTQFDLSLNWKLSSRLTLYVQGRNITNQVVKWMISPPGMVEGESPQLRQVQAYGANWVFGVRGVF
jgi:outer membrane receptor protein involved in Fe transport